jgi:hypothetical protein
MKLGHGSQERIRRCRLLAVITAILILPGAAIAVAQTPDKERNVVDQPAKVDHQVQPASHTARDVALPPIADSKSQPAVARAYDVRDLLERLKQDEGWPDDTPDIQLKITLLGKVQGNGVPTNLHAGMAGLSRVKTPQRRSHYAWAGDRLVVSGSEETHKQVKAEIERCRKYGFRQVTVEMRFMSGSADWCTPVDEEDGDDELANFRNRWRLFQHEFANAEPLEINAQSGAPDRSKLQAEMVQPPEHPTVRMSSVSSSPIVYQFADEEQWEAIKTLFADDVTQAPNVTLFDGQQVDISDVSQRPFVTDMTKIVGDSGAAYQPVVQVFWEGSKIQFLPVITDDGHHMSCRFRFATIEGCKTFRSPRFPEVTGLRVQHPIVRTNTFECALHIPTGQTLLIGGLMPAKVERRVEQGTFDRLLGRQPDQVVQEQVIYIAIRPYTLEPERQAQLRALEKK